MVTKTCFKHGDLLEKEIYVNKKGWKICRICGREASKINRTENKEKVAASNKRWYEKNPNYRKNRSEEEKDKINKRQKKYYHQNKERYSDLRKKNANRKISDKNNVLELKNSYIKGLIVRHSSLSRQDITPEWIELKRIVIKIKRKLRK